MVAVAERRARAVGLTNVTFRLGAAEELDEPPGSFDAVVSRFTIMFLPDLAGGLRHLHSLLRPGGRLAVSVWAGYESNPMMAVPRREIAKVVDLPAMDPTKPGPMRLSGKGELAAALTRAGFGEVSVAPVPMYWFARDPQEYWEMLTAMSVTFRRSVAQLSPEQLQTVRAGLTEAVSQYASGSVIRMPALAQVGTGTA
jgi:ubiquinone/menaquinone biosynthesis C-methylase UbiE